MNERIKELALQYGGKTGNSVLVNAELFEKFAELIVRECARVIAEDQLAKDCDTFLMNSYAKGMRYSAEVIKEHFGVEE